jgi:chloramphenicol-sensitive protein RarD
VSALEILAHRVVWSFLFLAVVLSLGKRWRPLFEILRQRRTMLLLIVTSALIAVNWLIYILSIIHAQVVQASLGYFVTPLVSVMLGVVFLGERLHRLQAIALVLASIGVLALVLLAGEWPWIALSLALTFSFYGFLRKRLPVDGLLALSAETIILLPAAAAFLIGDALVAPAESWSFDMSLAMLLSLSGIVTAVPLLCFGQAAQRLPLSTLGFLQFVSPSIQFALAVLYFGEPFDLDRLRSFAFIWAGLVLFSIDSYRSYQKQAAALPST